MAVVAKLDIKPLVIPGVDPRRHRPVGHELFDDRGQAPPQVGDQFPTLIGQFPLAGGLRLR